MEATRRFVVSGLLATAGVSVLPAGPALALGTAAAAATLQTFEVECSEFDTRSFRGLLLPNGLRVLLCSDPAAKKAAAAMDVQVGWMSDPRQLPGLAHFCEHMLFLGTSGFPDEGEFERYVAAAGGGNNAYTDSEETCYYFDVSAGALPALTLTTDPSPIPSPSPGPGPSPHQARCPARWSASQSSSRRRSSQRQRRRVR